MVDIPPLVLEAKQQARRRQQMLTKPAGALGELEELSITIAGITGRLDWRPLRRLVMICAGDHGVAAQGVSAYPQVVTQQMVINFLNGGAAVNVLARQMNARVIVVNAGIAADLDEHPDLINAPLGAGTQDFTVEPAMSSEQADQSIQFGIQLADQATDILAVGEMGIANTTAASAIIAAITGKPPAEVTGRGTGLDEQGLLHKISVIETALDRHQPVNQGTLQKLGGFEIGVMAGLMLGSATRRVPVVIDGLISTAAALIAAEQEPTVIDYLIAGHRSAEPGHIAALQHLGLSPLLDLGMRLGEGTGAVLAFPIIEAAMRTLQEMATFEDAGVSGRDAD